MPGKNSDRYLRTLRKYRSVGSLFTATLEICSAVLGNDRSVYTLVLYIYVQHESTFGAMLVKA
jgi:hypothetical protein